MQLAGPHVFGPPKDRAEAVAVLRAAVESGVDHIDTSDFYGPHVTNQIIREALAPYAEGLTIVTKVGAVRGEDGSWRPAQSPAALISGVQDNLRNLGVDVLDVVNMRFMGSGPGQGPAEGPVAEQFETLAELQRQGLIRHLGVSHATAAQVKEAREIAPVVCVQNEYNLANRGDDALIEELAAEGIAYVPYFPLGGFTPLQSSELSDVATELGGDADAGGAGVAAAAVGQCAADSGDVVGGASTGEPGGGGAGVVGDGHGAAGCDWRQGRGALTFGRGRNGASIRPPGRVPRTGVRGYY